MPLESKKRKGRKSKHQLETDEREEEVQVQRVAKRAKKMDNEVKKTARALAQERLDAKMEQILALQDITNRQEVVDDKEENAQQLGGTSRKKKAPQPKGRRGKKAAV